MVTTLERAVAICKKHKIEEAPHERKLLSILSDEKSIRKCLELKLIDSGFIWFLTLESILRFKFHATLRGDYGIFSQLKYQYIGDIPEFALDNAVKAISLGIEYITIHSNQNLKVGERAKTDPLLVGWFSEPWFRGDYSNLKQEGFVIAIWDNDKELEL